jgi:ATP-dependent helicase/nuclease subunit B
MAPTLHPAIAAALARGATLLTPNQRAARAIRQAFDAAQLAQSRTLWAPANVLPLETWLASLWHRRILTGAETRILLNRSQEHLLWREIIAAGPEAPTLRSTDALAEMAARAWSLACLYSGRTRLRDFALSTDSRAFDRWAHAFDRRLTRAQLITSAQLPAELAVTPVLPADPIALIDFDAHPPAISSLFETLHSSGLEIETIRTEVPTTQAALITAEDDQAELLAAAHWIRTHRQANPQARIAVVVPNLASGNQARRAQIERLFAPILSPELLPITAPASAPVYEFSLGRPLAELPIAIAALDLLAWPLQPLPLESITALLLSPWFGSGESAAAEFDAFELRQSNLLRPELTLEATIRLVETSRRREALPDLLQRLRSLHKSARATQLTPRPGQSEPHRQSFAQWADAFRTILDAAGWSRHARTDSLAFQQHRRWESALDELATLDAIPAAIPDANPDAARRPDAPEALASLTRILRQTVFAPESEDAPVQIMGPLELGGVAFDALWFLGADDLAWPAPPAASPLLPWQMQRALGVPGADRERDDARAQTFTTRIAHSAPEVVFSFARHSEEGDRRPSPLLSSLNLQPLAALDPQPAPEPARFETVPDDTNLPPLPPGVVKGGAQILKLQAACAFRAFAEKRLWSTQPAAAEPGLDALERGNLVHAVMQHFWTDLQTQDALRRLPLAERNALLDRAIDTALSASKAHPETPWDDAYLAVQRQRLRDLLQPWLDKELERSPFIVQPVEQKQQFELGPLTLDLRIDRIDETAAGLLILDYKTGDANPAHWKGERPDEPQLPLYAVLTQEFEQQLAGVAFALLRPGIGLGLKGYADDSQVFGRPAIMEAPSLAEQVEQWRSVLTRLASAYAVGDTRVAPKSYPQTCERCTQRILCRLNPASLEDLDEEESELEGEPAFG